MKIHNPFILSLITIFSLVIAVSLFEIFVNLLPFPAEDVYAFFGNIVIYTVYCISLIFWFASILCGDVVYISSPETDRKTIELFGSFLLVYLFFFVVRETYKFLKRVFA